MRKGETLLRSVIVWGGLVRVKRVLPGVQPRCTFLRFRFSCLGEFFVPALLQVRRQGACYNDFAKCSRLPGNETLDNSSLEVVRWAVLLLSTF